MKSKSVICSFLALFFAVTFVRAQEPQPEAKKPLSAQARLLAAKTVYLRNAGGTEVPFNIIEGAFESWPRYQIVNSPDQADLIVEVLAPEESTGTSVSGTSKDAKSGKSSTTGSHEFTAIDYIKLTVLDPQTKVALFSATEHPKNAWKEKNRTQSQIDCAQKLFEAFRNRIEPASSENKSAEPTK